MTKKEKVVVVEDDDEIESVKGPARSSPFHLLGAFCFILAIVAAVVCCLVSTLINVEVQTRGYIFFVTFVTFIVLLFFCLCCTYYLGASREAWETPTFTGVRWNFTNIVAMAGLFVEFIQICSFSFNKTFGAFYGSNYFEAFKYVATPYARGDYFLEAYWVMFVIAFSPYIFVIAIRILIYIYGIKRGADSAASVVERYQDNIYSILWFLVNTLYFPVITMMLTGTSCTFSDGGAAPTLDADRSIVCLQGKHIALLVCTMIALIIYYPAASFAQSQTQNISDIKFKPKVVFVMLQGKFVMGAICVAFGYQKYWAYISTAVIINFFFLVLNVVFQPCLLPWINRLRTVFFSLSFWASIVLAYTNIRYYSVSAGRLTNAVTTSPLIMLLVGWFIIVFFLVGFFLGFRRLYIQLTNKIWSKPNIGAGDAAHKGGSPQGADNEREMDELSSSDSSPPSLTPAHKPEKQQPQQQQQQPSISSTPSRSNANPASSPPSPSLQASSQHTSLSASQLQPAPLPINISDDLSSSSSESI
ncbi:hypothetical protein SAMD00019534_022840 [Acytostelium subglobosum LB1]|uniref:hypothetical protein n=1 Tax=Acytostelium subglobosum LB1 TaxID=1410327 RepID=UPI0006449B70|nr:hypothetical protein SAMD00019534_022840 [Acytostelium subglobosum LB1]GAM19109.1 hypothetical protein SAMD00019534_022840 [Acytostelium subglobosum LB1]|eukprot:XP_012757036.1 hypothetical protein SAMD00019534_022840 [Acytostelium subglobosum LB1]